MGVTVPFPATQPPGYSWLEGEVPFDPARHLALETPASITLLADLGYDEAEIATKATPVAASAPFRVLSDEGAEILLETTRRLRAFARSAGDRVAVMTRGGCYRSRWLRDLCTSPEVTAHLSAIYGVEIAPHAMPSQLGHINYEPPEVNTAVDKWHHDTLALDYVMMVTDPNAVPGGRFEYFTGTRDEAAALARQGLTPPRDRVVTPDFGGPGYAIALHGDMVVHRAAPVEAAVERITMVNGFTSVDAFADEQSRMRDLFVVDDPECLFTEWARFVAWRSGERLGALHRDLEFGHDRDAVIERLEHAIEDAQRAIAEMRAGPVEIEHYGG